MDFTNSFPGSWSLVRKNLPTLIGAGVGALAGSLSAGRRAYKQVQLDNKNRFPTWSEQKMRSVPARRVGGRRITYRRRAIRRTKPVSIDYRRVVRSTALNTITISAGTFNSLISNFSLNACQTSDLLNAYRLYRIRKVVLHLVPRIDPSNSSLANNFTSVAAAANDPEGTTAPGNLSAVTAYDNGYMKWLKSSQEFRYTFYPKVVNSVDVSGVATAAGSYGMNPWLQLNATGITVPHRQLVLAVGCTSTSTISFDFYFDCHFDVKGMA